MRVVNFRINVDQIGKEASFLNKKELVSVLMDSPLYFSHSVDERKELVENLAARIKQRHTMEQPIVTLVFTSVIQIKNRYITHIVSKYIIAFSKLLKRISNTQINIKKLFGSKLHRYASLA